ncbi:hypothetical protein [Wolbachia endosymbiont of Cantharis cryptica]|uniref:hypothetical protein n=1 Tax=Wolbachia endosymbiont of Cantharis cryptica TaxID=3066132 RepID=UPI00376EE8C7
MNFMHMVGLQKAKGYLPGFKRKRISIIGALGERKVKAPCVFEGYCNSELFEAYVENILIPIWANCHS